jgi:hypothetical protein
MKTRNIILLAVTVFVLVGCASTPKTADTAVQLGMSRDALRLYFGEPLRIKSGASGTEDWYYRFVAWKAQPTGSTETSEDFGEKTSYVSVGLEFWRNAEERPIHLSSEGYVIEPLPRGKVVKN